MKNVVNVESNDDNKYGWLEGSLIIILIIKSTRDNLLGVGVGFGVGVGSRE